MLKFSPHSRWRTGGPRRGQALLVAVLLMSVILLVGILFAAIVSFNQEQSARHLDLVAAQLQADAGINYASRMLESSPQGADWRPRFVPYVPVTPVPLVTDPTTWPADPASWPNPPAKYEDGSVDFNFYGPDGIEGSEDDYYSDFEIVRGWFPVRRGDPGAPGEFIRMGFFRFPDPNQVAAGVGAMDNPTIGRGYFLLQVTFDPDPPYEPGDPSNQDRMSGATRIISIGRSVEESNVFRRVVAYKPVGLMDQMRWITNKTGQASDAVLGVRANVDMDASKTWSPNESLFSYLPGPIRSEVPLYWAGQEVVNAPSTVFRLHTGPAGNEGYLRDDYVLATRGLYALDDPDAANGAAIQLNGPTGSQALLPVRVDQDAATVPDRVRVGSRDIPPLAPPDLEAADPTTGVSRYHALTRDSGRMMRATADDPANGIKSGEPVNTGFYGGGRGFYINNVNDVQYPGNDGLSDLSLLQSDWLKTPAGTGAADAWSGWNPLFTTYTPAGVEIEFFPTDKAVLRTCADGTWLNTPPTSPGTLWWPGHVDGEPGIKITRHDRPWRRADDLSGAWQIGEDSGQYVMVIDYPRYPNAVIMAEGNVRVKGILPARDTANRDRTYDVTVVSNATIYIDGQLMTAQDVSGRRYGTNDPSTGVLDEDTAKIALLARDSVCLNPTQLVPQLTRNAPARPDDEANPTLVDQHWELGASPDQVAYTQWRFGWPDIDWNNDGIGDGAPGANVPAGISINLTPIHTGADPGPSGMGMIVHQETPDPAATPPFINTDHVFDPANVDRYLFMFVPPGALFGGIPTPAPAASNAILPVWQTPGNTPSLPFDNPNVPFDISANVTRDIGPANGVTMTYRDPQIGAGATAYLLKKWKVEELIPVGGNDGHFDNNSPSYEFPRGAVHAKVNALMYAQRGSWFVIPGQYFDPQATTEDLDNDGTITALESLYAARFRRYNYEITVRGAIVEDHTAPIGAVQTWTNRWAYPIYEGTAAAPTLRWGTIRYQFDERLRVNRDQALTTLTGAGLTTRSSGSMLTTPESMLPKLPCLPSSPTLIYTGG